MNTEKLKTTGDADLAGTVTPERRNRRKGPERRKFDDPNYRGPERRSFGSSRLSDEIEAFFAGLGRTLCQHRLAAITGVLLIVLVLTGQNTRSRGPKVGGAASGDRTSRTH